jgi:hypothetical protein
MYYFVSSLHLPSPSFASITFLKKHVPKVYSKCILKMCYFYASTYRCSHTPREKDCCTKHPVHNNEHSTCRNPTNNTNVGTLVSIGTCYELSYMLRYKRGTLGLLPLQERGQRARHLPRQGHTIQAQLVLRVPGRQEERAVSEVLRGPGQEGLAAAVLVPVPG